MPKQAELSLSTDRDTNVELLKIYASVGIIVLHINNYGGGFYHAPIFSLNSYILYFLQAMFVSNVNLFVLISGYYLSEKKSITLSKPFFLLTQVVLFNEAVYVFGCILSGDMPAFTTLLRLLFPASYFAVLYVGLYILSPFINKLMKSISPEHLTHFVLIAFFLVSVWPYSVDIIEKIGNTSLMGLSTIGMYGSQDGYTIVNFMLMYIIGAYLRISEKTVRPSIAFLLLIGCWMSLFAFSYFLLVRGFGTALAYEYCSPLVIACAVLLFLLFKNFEIKSSRLINSLAKMTFSVYLLNITLIRRFFDMQKYAQANVILMLAYIALACLVISAVSWCAQMFYDLMVKCVSYYLRRTKLFNMKISTE